MNAIAEDVGIKSRALRVTLTIHAWTNTKSTRKATPVVVAAFNVANERRIKTAKVLIDPKEIKPVTDALRKIHDDHILRTLPWEDGGARILGSSGYMEYQDSQRKLKYDLDRKITLLEANWDALVERSLADLGDLADRANYPAAEELRQRYSADCEMAPIGDAADVRLQVSDEEVARIQKHVEERHARKMEGIMADIERRVKAVAERVYDRLHNYKPAVGGKRAENDFRDSLVTNVRELVDLLPSLNITNSAAIDRLRLDLMEISRYDAAYLKTDDTTRQKTAAAAKAILDKMGDFI